MHNFLLEHQIVTPFQSGFTSGDSTVNQLVDMYNTFCQALDEGKEVRVVFCDISKAFDRVWHKGLIAVQNLSIIEFLIAYLVGLRVT